MADPTSTPAVSPTASTAPVSDPNAPTPAGLIGAYSPALAPATATTYTAVQQAPAVSASTTNRVVDPTTETVQGQLSGIIAANSPLMQQAVSTAKQQMNDRGLLNSSTAIGAAQGALYSAATPIAAADANTYSTASAQNKSAADAASIANAQAANAVNANNANFANSAAQANAQLQTNTAIANLNAQLSRQNAITAALSAQAIEKMDVDSKIKLANIQADYQTLNQTSGAASSLSQTTMQQLNAIVGDSTLTPDMQKAKYNAVVDNYQSAMNLIGSINGIDLTSLLTFPKIQ